jgi:hypothetical protein
MKRRPACSYQADREGIVLVLAVYGVLASVRYYLAGSFTASFPVLILLTLLLLNEIVPSFIASNLRVTVSTRRVSVLLGIIIGYCLITAAIVWLDSALTGQTPVNTARGLIRREERFSTQLARILATISAETLPDESIFVPGFSSGLYYFSNRPNPTISDVLIAGVMDSEEEARFMVESVQMAQPKLIVVPTDVLELRRKELPIADRVEQIRYTYYFETYQALWEMIDRCYRLLLREELASIYELTGATCLKEQGQGR